MKFATLLVLASATSAAAFAPIFGVSQRKTAVHLGKEGNVDFGGNSWKPVSICGSYLWI